MIKVHMMTGYKYNDQVYKSTTAEKSWSSFHGHRLSKQHHKQLMMMLMMVISLDQNKLFVSESKVPLTQLAKWYKEPTKQFSEL